MSADPAVVRAKAEREYLRSRHPKLFNDGARRGFLKLPGYPDNFPNLPIEARNAWFAGWNLGHYDHVRHRREVGR